MQESLQRQVLTGLALSTLLALLPFCWRSDSLLLISFEDSNTTLFFVIAFAVGALLACIALLKAPLRAHPMPVFIGLTACLIVAFAIALTTQALFIPAMLVAPCMGLLLGFAFTAALGLGLSLLLTFSSEGRLLSISGALLLTALFTYFIGFIENYFILCVTLFILGAAGIVLLLWLFKTPACTTEAKGAITNKQSSSPMDKRDLRTYGWSGIAALAFNFLTLGLTYWPESAGLQSQGPNTSKIVAYVIIFVVSLVTVYFARKQHESTPYELFYKISLPVGIAISLASPFLDNVIRIASIPVISSLFYLGIALLFVLGLLMTAWMGSKSYKAFTKMYLIMVASCCTALLAGMLLFSLFGSSAQLISLCILTAFIVALLVATIISNTNKGKALTHATEENRSLKAEQLGEEFSLSSREQEILGFLSRGRGSKYIANELCISPETVRTHSKRIYEKMNVHSREELLDLFE